MGTKRIGLARVEALIENLKRDLSLGDGAKINGVSIDPDIPFEMLGLANPLCRNFGGPTVAGLATEDTDNILTQPLAALNIARALEGVANASAPPTAAVTTKIFGGSGVAGLDVAIGTTAAPAQTPMVDQRVSRLTGDISGTVTMSTAADMVADNTETLILFTGNTFSSSGILKFDTHANRGLDASSCEVFVTANGSDELTRVAVCSDDDTLITITDAGDCTILAGSYLYFHSNAADDSTAIKGVIRTTGGTVGVTFAA